MADAVRATVRFAAWAAIALLAALVLAWGVDDGADGHEGVVLQAAGETGREPSGEPLRLAQLDGPAPMAAHGVLPPGGDGHQVIVLKLERASLEVAAQQTGRDVDRFAVPHPNEPDHVLVVYSAASKHLGCTVVLEPLSQTGGTDGDGDAVPEMTLLDPCHQFRWDPYRLGILQGPVFAELPPLDVYAFELEPLADGLGIRLAELWVQEAPYDALSGRGQPL